MKGRGRNGLGLVSAVFLGLAFCGLAAVEENSVTSERIVDRCVRELPGFPVILSIGHPASVVVADLNKDGAPDLALTTFEILGNEHSIPKLPSRLWVLFGEHLDHWQAKEPVLLYEVYHEGGALLLRAGDLTGDGFANLVVGDLFSSSITIFDYENSGFVEKASFSMPTPYRLIDFSLADLDGDGKMDVVIAGQRGVLVFWNLGCGALAPALIVDYGDYGDAVRVACGDFNGDGRSDIGVLGLTGTENGVEHWVDVILNAGNRQFIRTGHVRMDKPALGVYLVLAAGDVDRDGYCDLVTAYNDRILVLFGYELGTITIDSMIFNPAMFVPAIALHDLTGNGCLNIIMLTPEFDSVSISRECYTRVAPRMLSGFGIRFPSPHACAVADIGGLPYLVLAGARWDTGQSKTVLSLFMGCGKEGR